MLHAHTAAIQGRARAKSKHRSSELHREVQDSKCQDSKNLSFVIDRERQSGSSSIDMFYKAMLGGQEEPDQEAPDPRAESPVDDWRVQRFIIGAILLNALQMGLQVDLNGDPYDAVWRVLTQIFTAIFALEMLAKLWFLRCAYFRDAWNWLDFIIAWLGIFDCWILPFFVTEDAGLLPFQTLRLVRMVKVLRMRKELMALTSGLVGSLRSMLWIGILLGMVIYTFGIFCAQIIGSEDYSETSFTAEQYFGSLPRAMLTLFSICIVDSWGTIVFSLWNVQPFLVPVFMVFLVLTSFGLLNALIGVIVEQTTLATEAMKLAEDLDERKRKMQIVKSLVHMVLDIDKDSDGCISAEEMRAAEGVSEMQNMLGQIDLPPGFTLVDLHTMLDRDGSGELDKDEFIGGMYRLLFCNEFQSHCLGQLGMSQTRKAIISVTAEVKREIQAACAHLKEDFEAMLQKHMVSPSGTELAVEELKPPKVRSKGSIFDECEDESPEVAESKGAVDTSAGAPCEGGGVSSSSLVVKEGQVRPSTKVRQAKKPHAAKVVSPERKSSRQRSSARGERKGGGSSGTAQASQPADSGPVPLSNKDASEAVVGQRESACPETAGSPETAPRSSRSGDGPDDVRLDLAAQEAGDDARGLAEAVVAEGQGKAGAGHAQASRSLGMAVASSSGLEEADGDPKAADDSSGPPQDTDGTGVSADAVKPEVHSLEPAASDSRQAAEAQTQEAGARKRWTRLVAEVPGSPRPPDGADVPEGQAAAPSATSSGDAGAVEP